MKRNWVWGILLILVGLYFLLTELGVLTINLMYLLPLAVLAFIIYMQLQYFKEGCVDTGKPVLSGMLLGLAVIIFFCVKDGWDSFRSLYPLILLGMSLGIGEEIITRNGRSGSWVFAGILAAVSLVLLFGIAWSDMWRFGLPIVLILAGISVLWKPLMKK